MSESKTRALAIRIAEAQHLQPLALDSRLFVSFEEELRSLVETRPSMIFGAPGSGKSTLLRNFAASSQERALKGLPDSAVLLHAGRLTKGDSWLDELERLLLQQLGISTDRDVLQLALSEGALCVVIDGLDEVAPVHRRVLGEELSEAISRNQISRLLLSCRTVDAPTALVRRLHFVEVPPLDRRRAGEFLRNLQPGAQEHLDELYELSGGNPLMLRLLGDTLERRGVVPRARWDFLRDAVEGLLVVLVEALVPPSGGLHPSIDQVLAAHGELAFAMLLEEADSLPRSYAAEIFGRHLAQDQIKTLLAVDEDRALLRKLGREEVGFSHRFLVDFLAASSAAEDPGRLQSLASVPTAAESVGLALALSRDPSLGVLAIAERPGLSILDRLGPQLSELPKGALARARRILAEQTATLLSGGEPPVSLPPVSEEGGGESKRLLERWLALEKSTSYGHERGLELELFMVDFFSRFFDVVEHDYRTDTGQIDLLLENIQSNPFWLGHHVDIYVECKNTRDKTELSAVNDFAGKLASSPTTLAFFVSQAGFTKPAWDRIKSAAHDPTQTTIVPIAGEMIRRTLEDDEDPERFFKTAVRNTQHGRTFKNPSSS